jgi:antitoxin component of RelBE/YafQ-DinJ toxin-antitoxin module
MSKNKKVRLPIDIPENLRNKFKSVVYAKGLTMNNVITELIKQYIETK